MVIPELEQQLLQLSHNDKLYIIQLLAQSLTTSNTNSEQPTKISEFFRQSPLAELTEELDLNRDRSLPRDTFNP
ncbi:hypothetical protein H5968_10980 [Sphaerospermopsis sp. LEGE 00249]|jgi:hypothetical protein|uniref:hypothetical protein n=1 Tax=Sphaerospermopsis sp. LEGE 00249 TaxID=1380707 RepID=UPI00164D7254|nr:hypothetical protein [Sphaerospermopsis sp. LEGE 00249]MBC5795657.1 hypothetical protein [Sphaerospermopsis sp. LEGE 00249]